MKELKKLKRSGTKKKVVKKQPRKTEKQRKLIKLISENLSTTGLTKSLTQLMKDAGYSDSSSRQQAEIMNRLDEEINPVVNAMIKERDAAIKRMAQIRGKAKYRDLTDAIDKLTKNAQLLSGKETEKVVQQVQIYVPQRA